MKYLITILVVFGFALMVSSTANAQGRCAPDNPPGSCAKAIEDDINVRFPGDYNVNRRDRLCWLQKNLKEAADKIVLNPGRVAEKKCELRRKKEIRDREASAIYQLEAYEAVDYGTQEEFQRLADEARFKARIRLCSNDPPGGQPVCP